MIIKRQNDARRNLRLSNCSPRHIRYRLGFVASPTISAILCIVILRSRRLFPDGRAGGFADRTLYDLALHKVNNFTLRKPHQTVLEPSTDACTRRDCINHRSHQFTTSFRHHNPSTDAGAFVFSPAGANLETWLRSHFGHPQCRVRKAKQTGIELFVDGGLAQI